MVILFAVQQFAACATVRSLGSGQVSNPSPANRSILNPDKENRRFVIASTKEAKSAEMHR